MDNSGSGDGQSSTLNWPAFYVGGKNPLSRVKGMKILSAEIPFSYYVFTSTNNAFELSANGTTGWVRVVIPPGNYTKDSILPALKTVIEAALPGVMTVTYNASTMKLGKSCLLTFR